MNIRHDYAHRDGRKARAPLVLRLLDAITRRRAQRPAGVVALPVGLRLHTLGELGIAASDHAGKRQDARLWLLQQRRRRVTL